MTDVLQRPRSTAAPAAGARPSARGRSGVGSSRRLVLGLAGLLLVAGGGLGSVVLNRAGDRRVPVLVVAREVAAGAQIGDGDLGVVDVAVGPTVAVVAAGDRARVVGMYARSRLVAGALLVAGEVQAAPLVSAGMVVVAVPVTNAVLPFGLREQSRVRLVVTATAGQSGGAAPGAGLGVEGTVVRLPVFGRDGSTSAPLSVEIDPSAAAAIVQAGRNVAVVLVNPSEGSS